MKRLTLALTLSAIGCLVADEWRVALVPPADNTHAHALVRAVAQRVGLPVDLIAPEDFVNDGVFNAEKYPLAVYTGHERYCYTVKETGDGAKALLRYLNEGGTLLVAGLCWPLYRPYDWDGKEWQPSSGKLPEFKGGEDEYLAKQMAQFNQNADSSFSRQLGLNISGTGTKQFEVPEESVTFVCLPKTELRWPEDTPYPLPGGDMRFRPISTVTPSLDLKIEPLVTLKGESGMDYGTAFAFVTHPGVEGKQGMVAYVSEPLLRTPRGADVVFSVLGRTAERNGFVAQGRSLNGLQDRLAKANETIAALPPTSPVGELFRREVSLVAAGLADCQDAATVGSGELAKRLAQAIEARLALLEGRLGGK